MSNSASINLIEKLTEHSDYYAAIFFTYGTDLAFFEEAVLYSLWQNGCRNNLVFMDAQRYVDTIDDLRGSVTWVGRRYLLIPVDLGAFQIFHPKLVLLLGRERGRLLIGSGNLTFTGFGHNHELFTCLDWTPDSPDLQYLFAQAWSLINRVFQQWGHSNEARLMLSKTAYVVDWIVSPTEPPADLQFLHTLDERLIDQCSHAIGEEVIEEITVLSPFLDDAALALKNLHSQFRPRKLRLILQDERAVGNVKALESMRRTGVPLELRRFESSERYVHAKAYFFKGAKTSYMLTGSANCTRSAWLTTCDHGNVEVALLRRASSGQHFASIVDTHISSEPVTSPDEINFLEQEFPVAERQAPSVQLLDVSSSQGLLSVSYLVSSSNEEIIDLCLRVSATPPHFINLGQESIGRHVVEKPISPEIRTLLTHPLPASVWGLTSDGEFVDLCCNELWITNVDVLRYEVSCSLPADVRTGGYLAEMILDSEDEWGDLYASLSQLIELEVAGLKRRGGTYTASPLSKHSKTRDSIDEHETEVRLVDEQDEAAWQEEVATTLFRESQFCAWFEHVRAVLPGAAFKRPGPHRRPEPPSEKPAKHRRRRWTPPERIGRRFVNLVHRYIDSLMNAEYMQTVSIYHILAYYSVFQRIVWLLLQHSVIDTETFVQLVTQINRGFFGGLEDDSPILCPRVCRHMQRVWCDDWWSAEVPYHALGSVVLVSHWLKSLPVKEAGAQVIEQNLRVLCGIASVTGLSWAMKDSIACASVAEVYGQNANAFATRARRAVSNSLSDVAAILEGWTRQITVTLGRSEAPHLVKLLLQARIDYGMANYDILACIGDVDAQIRLCSDLVFWMRCAGASDDSQEWSVTLVGLLQSQGKGQETAHAMFHQGRDLFYDGDYQESANILRQALALAERLGDGQLSTQCEQYLGHTEFFLH
jgi:hypothetical protein